MCVCTVVLAHPPGMHFAIGTRKNTQRLKINNEQLHARMCVCVRESQMFLNCSWSRNVLESGCKLQLENPKLDVEEMDFTLLDCASIRRFLL